MDPHKELEAILDVLNASGLGDREVNVVSKDGLIVMKERAGRPQDLVDIDNLKKLREND